MKPIAALMALSLFAATASVRAFDAPAGVESEFDPALAHKLGADERGMRHYVLVILKTGPHRMLDGEARKAMFAGHFANIGRLAKAGKLALAGPFADDGSGWRGLFVFAVDSVDEAKKLAETDPVIVNGEMVAEYHPWYGSAAVMQIPALHDKLVPPSK
jgi:uncharacterized protein YciI